MKRLARLFAWMVLAAAFGAMPGTANGQVFVSNFFGGVGITGNGSIDGYNLTTGALTSGIVAATSSSSAAPLIAVSGNNLYVGTVTYLPATNSENLTITQYNATTGQPVTTNGFPTTNVYAGSLYYPYGLAASGNNLFVSNFFGGVGITGNGSIDEYNLTTGALTSGIVAATSSSSAAPLIAVSGNNLYVGTATYVSATNSENLTITQYNATTGDPVTTSGFPQTTAYTGSLYYPYGLAASGNNLFVSNFFGGVGITGNGSIDGYNLTTGALTSGIVAATSSSSAAPLIAVSGNNLYVGTATYVSATNSENLTITQYDATTGDPVTTSGFPQTTAYTGSLYPYGLAAGTITDQQKQSLMLGMVNQYRGSLPTELVLADICTEGGQGAFYCNGEPYNSTFYYDLGPWEQPETNTFGIMQVEPAAQLTAPYTDTQVGYDDAIEDGCAYLNVMYKKYGTVWEAILHYNGGYGCLYTYENNRGNSDYLSDVADNLNTFVPSVFSISNPTLVANLNTAQTILDTFLNNPAILPNQPQSYYTAYQNQLNAQLHILGAPPQPYNQWTTQNSVTGGPSATPEGDGVPNLLKYLYDINPSGSMSSSDRAALPVLGINTIPNSTTQIETALATSNDTTSSTTYLTLTYRQYSYATGLTVNVQTSPDLQTWTTVNPPDLSEQIGFDPNTGDPIVEIGVIATGATQFIRLNVTQP